MTAPRLRWHAERRELARHLPDQHYWRWLVLTPDPSFYAARDGDVHGDGWVELVVTPAASFWGRGSA